MRRSRRLRLAYLAAWVVLAVAVALQVVERSGALSEALRERVAWRLGPLGDGLELGRVRVSLLTPSLTIEDVRLTSPKTGVRLLELDRIEVQASFPPSRVDPVELVRVDGGTLRVGDELLAELRRILASVGPEEPTESGFTPPPAVLRGIDVELELPRQGGEENLLELGRLSVATRAADEGLTVVGELVPWLNGATRRTETIGFEGSQSAEGFEIVARTRELDVSSARFEAPPVIAALPLDAFAGELDVDAELSLRLTDAGTRLAATLRAQLSDGGLTITDHSPLEDATVAIEGRMEVEPGGSLWAREAWRAHSRIEASWLGAPIECFGSFGRAAPPASLMMLWAHAPEFPLSDPEVERLIANAPWADSLREALEPRGEVDLTIATTFPTPDPEAPGLADPEALVRFGFDGRAGITFRGFYPVRPPADGSPPAREGFPIPTDLRSGAVVVHDDPRRSRRTRVVLRDVEARSRDASVDLAGVIASPLPGSEIPEVDLLVELLEVRVGEELREALAGHPATRTVWDDYAPEGGVVRGRVEVAGGDDLRGTVSRIQLDLAGVGATWKDLPVPVRDLAGTIDVRSSEERSETWRPVGASVLLATDEAESDGFRLDLRYRQDEVLTPGRQPLFSIDVELDRLLLRGSRWERLRAQFPEVGQIVGELGASGGVRVRYRGVRERATDPFVNVTEVVPGDPLMLRPTYFPRTTRGLRGRVLVRNEVDEGGVDHGSSRWLLAATWPDDVHLMVDGEVPHGAEGRSRAVAAGIDPTNETFRGALQAATGAPGQGSSIDLTENAVEGRLDARVTTLLPPGDDAEPVTEVAVVLRGNTLRNASIELEGLSGVLEQSGEVFRAAHLDAELAGHAIELDEVALFPLGVAHTVPERDSLLARENYWLDPNGICLQAKLSTRDLPLDETHLEHLLSTEALEWIRQDPDWAGELDLDRAQLVLTNEGDGSGKVAIYGRAVVHDLSLRPGVAIEVERLDANVRELVVEAGRIRMWGEVENLAAEIEARPLEDASMIVSYLDGRLNVDNLDGAFCGGRLRSAGSEAGGASTAVAADLGDPYGFDLRLVLDQVEADSFLRGVFQSNVADRGRIDGALFLRGKPSDVLGIRGNGWVRVDDAQLYSIPVIRALFGALGFDESAVFDRMRSRFQWRDGRILMNDIVVKSTLLKLVGEGWMDLSGRLHHDLEVRYSLVDRLGPLALLVYWINNALVSVEIRGDMDRPDVAIDSLFRGLLGSARKPGRRLPLPPFAELEPRF